MRRMQVTVLITMLAFFGFLVWLTQKDSFSKTTLPPGLPGISPSTALPPEKLDIFNQSGQSPNQERQQAEQQTQQQQQVVQGPIKEDLRATISAQIKTSKGNIRITLFNQDAKGAVKNFIDKAESGFYKNLAFHRVEDWVVQGGDPKGNGTGGGAFQSELTGKSFVAGSLGWAASSNMQIGQGARISNDSQFFIVKSDAPWLDATYTNFGIVEEGMDAVNSIKIGDKILGITVE
ncbi:MAG: peptidylprolyl isomerase [Candidatus Levybacteria bacterium]|nr:peptidylprolyl isomerase [Candidatus Levybacteria bacterium]